MKRKAAAGSKNVGKSNRGFLKGLFRFFIILLIMAFVCVAIGTVETLYYRTHYKISFYQKTSGKVSGNIRLAVISDIHNREYGKNNEALISGLRALEPDLILFPGDMVIRENDDYQPMLDLVSSLSGIAPCYGILGNHESERIYSLNDKDLPEKFESAGLKLLRNASEKIQIGNDTVQLIGVEGTAYGFEEYGGREFMDKTDIDPSAYCILMAHIPVLFKTQLSAYGFDLGIAGHVHGGIVRLPFFGGLYSYEEGFFPELTAGKYIMDNGQTLIISAGLGDSKPFPLRINNTPELVVADINRY